MNILKKYKWCVIVLFIIVGLLVLYKCGFKIAYAPEIEDDWDAIEAVGTWIGVLSPLFITLINASFARKVEKTKSEIAQSNKVIFKSEFEKNHHHSIEDQVINYITVSITATTKEIAVFCHMETEEAYQTLEKLEIEKMIVAINKRKFTEKDDVLWKIATSL